jgi:uncharacterized damage-inducible protein DinB
MTVKDLTKDEYLNYFKGYILNVPVHLNILEALSNSHKEVLFFLESIPEAQMHYRYAEGKWDIREIINHLIDSERIFNYRALRIARKDKTPLSGFEEDNYVSHSNASSRSKASLLAEYTSVRQASILLFSSFTEDMLKEVSIAGSGNVSCRALGFLISGHELHHMTIIKERYL